MMKNKTKVIKNIDSHIIMDVSRTMEGFINVGELIESLENSKYFNDESPIVVLGNLACFVFICDDCDNLHITLSDFDCDEEMFVLWKTDFEDKNSEKLTKKTLVEILKNAIKILKIKSDAGILIEDGGDEEFNTIWNPLTLIKKCKSDCVAVHLDTDRVFLPN